MFSFNRAVLICLFFLLVFGMSASRSSGLPNSDRKAPETIPAVKDTSANSPPCPADPETDSDSFTKLMQGDLAGTDTDEFTWRVLAEIIRPAVNQRPVKVAGGGVDVSNDEDWETWADDSDLFPAHPDEDNPPCWSQSREKTGVKLTSGLLKSQVAITKVAASPNVNALGAQKPNNFSPSATPISGCVSSQGQCDEVRHNRQDFNSIVVNGLWYVQGLKKEASAGLAPYSYIPQGQKMDPASIEIKTEWKALPCKGKQDCDAKKMGYHWNYDKDGNLYGLVAMHLITKALPNWTWATFEWIGNKGICDSYGCKDSFGDPTGRGQTVPLPTLNENVTKILPVSSLDEWKNYRLKGTQTDFCANGQDLPAGDCAQPTYLGNSVLERSVVPGTASCIGCHAMASVDSNGKTTIGQFITHVSPQGSPGGTTQQQGIFGMHAMPNGTHPIGFIWSVSNAVCDPNPKRGPC